MASVVLDSSTRAIVVAVADQSVSGCVIVSHNGGFHDGASPNSISFDDDDRNAIGFDAQST